MWCFRRDNQSARCVAAHGGEIDGPSHLVTSGLDGDDVVAGGPLHGMVNRNVGERCQKAAGQHNLLAADPVGERSKEHESRHA